MDPPLHTPWGGGLFLNGGVRSAMAAGRRMKPAVRRPTVCGRAGERPRRRAAPSGARPPRWPGADAGGGAVRSRSGGQCARSRAGDGTRGASRRAGAGARCARRRAGADGRVAAASSRGAWARRRPERAGGHATPVGDGGVGRDRGHRRGGATAGGGRARALSHRAGGGQQRPPAWRGEPCPGVARGKAGGLPSSWLSTMGVVSCANRGLPGRAEERDCLACANEQSFWEGRCGSSRRRGPGRGSR